MKKFCFLLLVPLAALAASPEENSASAVVQEFYDAYIKLISDPKKTAEKWVLQSPALTADFKAAYRKQSKSMESDPIICGQDFPDAGYKVQSVKIDGDKGVVTLASRDPQFQNTFPVYVIREKGRWLIQGTKDLQKP